MKRHWLRGLLLGVSLALLLGGGVALAQSMSIEPYCNVCCMFDFQSFTCDPPIWTVITSGWGANEDLTLTLTPPGTRPPVVDAGSFSADGDGKFRLDLGLACSEPISDGAKASGLGWTLLFDWQADDYGVWGLLVEGATGAVEGDFYFAEDPSACEVEFVPEPGSILLLGSGLVGLAGYATLRWRTRE